MRAAATPVTVATARATQDGSTAAVRGDVVGQPTASATVVRSGFPSDYADTPTQTDTTTNAQDPPDAFEKRRNDIIQTTYQGNRNPFIDHPEWADASW